MRHDEEHAFTLGQFLTVTQSQVQFFWGTNHLGLNFHSAQGDGGDRIAICGIIFPPQWAGQEEDGQEQQQENFFLGFISQDQEWGFTLIYTPILRDRANLCRPWPAPLMANLKISAFSPQVCGIFYPTFMLSGGRP